MTECLAHEPDCFVCNERRFVELVRQGEKFQSRILKHVKFRLHQTAKISSPKLGLSDTRTFLQRIFEAVPTLQVMM